MCSLGFLLTSGAERFEGVPASPSDVCMSPGNHSLAGAPSGEPSLRELSDWPSIYKMRRRTRENPGRPNTLSYLSSKPHWIAYVGSSIIQPVEHGRFDKCGNGRNELR